MTLRRNKTLIAMTFALGVAAGCATKPPSFETIASSANPSTEIERTDEMLKDAKDRQVDVLSPENFTDAQKSLEKAKKAKDKGKSNEKILESVAYSRGWLKEANEKADIAQTSLKDISDARAGALRAGTPTLYKTEWNRAENDLEDITTSIEKGNLTPAEKRGDKLTAEYRELERKSIIKAQLSRAEDNIKAAKKDGAEKRAPKTFNLANMKYENAERLILSDPRNLEAIRRASEDATQESSHLVDVTRKVKAGNTEDLVLLAERQQRTISSLRGDYTSSEQELQRKEQELQQSQTQLDAAARERMALAERQGQLEQESQKSQNLSATADRIRKQFKPSEAEVFTEGNRLMVRLKALQFATNKSEIGPKSANILKKVESALADVNASKVTIEGHSDSTGDPEKNVELSEKRAEAVEKYLVRNGIVAENKVEAVGVGPEKPISDNTTPQGRAQNRRIDLVIETE
ncbi:OmpA family protein [Bdellovibrio reynosensis]|uniref:OmpA family protein n=1 Tax=Bdellovibrio reynosensis TaxID=2835041 RepID=A0ABY4C9E2_9BACT|nr:OmpA family protein [Bdellovibrio reynosensis]UOF01565.1 OmpA family protein [Bdellovibrio reynosensis]